MKRNVLIASALAGAVVLSAGVANAAGNACSGVVSQQLAAAGVNQADVKSVDYAVHKTGSDKNRGWLAWVDLANKPGSLVVDVDPNCRVRQVYTRDGLQLPGVKSF